MLVLAWVTSIALSLYVGYQFREWTNRVKVLEQSVKAKVDKKPVETEPQSEFIDPTDEVQTAIYEHKKMMSELNPDE